MHITTNNTIFGTQFKFIPETSVPLVADMSSDIFSRTLDYSKFSLVYAGAQKNLGPAGTTLVLIKETLFDVVSRQIPSMLNYKIYAEKDSMFNTPPVFAVYATMLNMRWIKAQGGLISVGDKNSIKANMIYNEIDRNSKFKGFAAIEDRSCLLYTSPSPRD